MHIPHAAVDAGPRPPAEPFSECQCTSASISECQVHVVIQAFSSQR